VQTLTVFSKIYRKQLVADADRTSTPSYAGNFRQDKVMVDFAILAIALNLSKLARKMSEPDKNRRNTTPILHFFSGTDCYVSNKTIKKTPAIITHKKTKPIKIFFFIAASNYFDIQVSSQISNNGQGTQIHIPISLMTDTLSA
jgi:hypothetical protein